jgi:hypothetical protein
MYQEEKLIMLLPTNFFDAVTDLRECLLIDSNHITTGREGASKNWLDCEKQNR